MPIGGDPAAWHAEGQGFDGPVMRLRTGHFLERRVALPWLMGARDVPFDRQGACLVITRPLSLNHIAYPTWDSAATYRFYTEVLRCEFIAAIQLDTVPSTGANTPYLHTFYRLQRGGCIAFFEVDDLDEPAPDGIPAWIRHLALDVASLEELSEWRDHFEAHGLSPVGIVDHDGVWESLYIFDPQGVRIELTVQNRPLGESDRESGLKTLAQWAVRHGQDFVVTKP